MEAGRPHYESTQKLEGSVVKKVVEKGEVCALGNKQGLLVSFPVVIKYSDKSKRGGVSFSSCEKMKVVCACRGRAYCILTEKQR